MKTLLAGGALLAALLVVALVVLVTLVDVNRFKPQIEQLAGERLHRRLTIDGKLTLALVPRIAVAIPHATLSERGADATPGGSGDAGSGARPAIAASLDSARVSVALLPLLRGRIEAGSIRIDGLQARVERRPDGTTSIDDLLHAGAPGASGPIESAGSAAGATPAPAIGLPRFEIGAVELHRAQLTFDDRRNPAAHATYVLSAIELETGRLANVTHAPIVFTAHLAATRPPGSADLSLSGTLDLDLDRGVAAATDLAADLKAELDGAGGGGGAADASTREPLAAALKARRVAVDRASGAISIEQLDLAASGRHGTAQLDSAHLAAPALAFDTVRKVLSVGGLDLAAHGQLGADRFETTLSAPKIEASAQAASGERIQATLKLAGQPAPAIDARLVIEGLGGTLDQMTIGKLALDAEMHQAQRSMVLALSSPATASAANLALALTRLTADVVVDDPVLPQKTLKLPLSGLVAVDAHSQAIDVKLSTRLDDSRLDASAEVHGFARPRITFDLQADRLNLDRYRVPAAARPAPSGPTQGGTAPAVSANAAAAALTGDATPIDVAPLETLDLGGQIRIGSLQVRGLKASQVALDLKAGGGRLELAPLAAKLYGGALNASASVSVGAATGNRFATRAALAGVALGPLLRDLLDRDLVDGHGDLNLDLSSSGTTLGALKRGLEGSAAVVLRDGALKGINIAQKLRDAAALRGNLNPADTRSANPQEKTDFTEMSASFVVRQGVASSHDLDAKSPLLRLAGEGTVDLAAAALDCWLRVSVVGTLKGQDGRDLAQLRGVTVPLHATGPFDRLAYTLDWSSIALQLAKAKALDALRAGAAPKLQDALKGLLGGKQ